MCESIQETPTTRIHTGGLTTLFHDFRGQMSWGRFCAFVSLTVAVVLSFQDKPDLPLISTWLGHTFGEYAASKVTEMVVSAKGAKP